jgi:hypothetical protein
LVGLALLGAGAAFAQTPEGLPDEGVLRLRLGPVDQLVWETPSTTDVNPTQSIDDRRSLTGRASDKCLLQLGPVGSPPNLLDITAGVPATNKPGFAFDRIGVFSRGSGERARGVDCARVGANESLTLRLAGALVGRLAHRAELNVEVKQNARIRAVLRLGGIPTQTFELRSGGGIVAGEGSSEPGSQIFNCAPSSDSGPDAGDLDHCRWVIDGLWDSLELTTLAGEWSLAGGSRHEDDDYHRDHESRRDFHACIQDTLIFLTRASGVLDCGDSTITAGDGDASALATGLRLENATGTECTPIPYFLSSNGNRVTFLKELSGQTDIATIFKIEWLQEAAGFPIHPTLQLFGNSESPIPINLCVGTPIPGGDPFAATGLDLSEFSPESIDQDPTLPGIQYGCLLSETTDYVAPGQIKVTQLIYLRGDWSSFR